MDLEILSAKLGISKSELFDMLKRIILADLNDHIDFYSEKASSTDMINYLNHEFSEEALFDKLSEELECLQD